MSRPIIPLLIAFIAGIFFSYLFKIPALLIQVTLTATLSFILVTLMKSKRFFYPALLFSLFLLGIMEMNMYLHPHINKSHINHYIGSEKVKVEGVICENPQVSPEKTELVVCVNRILNNGQYTPVWGRVLLNVREPYTFHYGDSIRFHSRLRAPRNFANPGGFDYERYLRFRGILVRGFINETAGIVVLRREIGNPLRIWLERFREFIRKTIRDTAPGTEGKIIQAMILGDQKEIPKEDREKFNRTGTTHIIAISGFNIGIVALFSFFVIRLLLKSSEYLLLRWNMVLISTLFAIILVILYTFIAGSGISVIRASVMVVLFMVAIMANRERDLYNILSLAAFFILIVNPYSLFDISFQLSFVAVISLLFLTPRLVNLLPSSLITSDSPGLTRKEWLLKHLKKILRTMVLFFFASLSATLGTLPLILFYFNRLSLVTLIANFLVVPILGVMAIPLCLLIVFTAPISHYLTEIILYISMVLVKISLFLIERLASLPWSSVFVSTPTPLEIVVFYLLLISAGFLLDQLRGKARMIELNRTALLFRAIPVFLILFFIVDGIWIHLKGVHTGKLSLTAVDVGQGSSILVRLPGGKRILVDGGGFFDETFDVGKYVLAPFLWYERISSIDIVVLTHAHPDHLRGLLFVLENFHVGEVWTNGEGSDSPVYLSFLRIIRDRGIVLRTISDLTPEINISGVKIRILNPQIPSTSRPSIATSLKDTPVPLKRSYIPSDPINERSVVMKFSFGSRTFLLPGDIMETSEMRLVDSPVDLTSDVLFVPHHGASRSSTIPFLEKVRPQIAVISCGFDNVFRFPHPETLGRYERLQSRIYRTDLNGAVTIVTNGNDLQSSVFRPGNS
ncbi:MAG: DNA internalization-related competence protein ComEC/Rec2 [Deltaproteobacteria bacterium]|nr:DNA internalization-related competence protein ComEC/Rec2 [Bacillota bacterium]MCL5807875.1 DNA internalization-related competence protein ComEC/Rec2 [Deltaproteobacteria bacterium]